MPKDIERKKRVGDGRRGKQGTYPFDTTIGENTSSGMSSHSGPDQRRGKTWDGFHRGLRDDEPARQRRLGKSQTESGPKSRGDAKFFLK